MTNGQILEDLLKKIVKIGEMPYQANRKALQKIDIFYDDEAGRQYLVSMRSGLDAFIRGMEGFKYEATSYSRKARNSIR
jgi:hypothetical protein